MLAKTERLQVQYSSHILNSVIWNLRINPISSLFFLLLFLKYFYIYLFIFNVQTLERELRETREMLEAKSKALEERIDNEERVNEDYRDKVDQLMKQMEALQKPPRQSPIQPHHRFYSRIPATFASRSNQQSTGRGKGRASKN